MQHASVASLLTITEAMPGDRGAIATLLAELADTVGHAARADAIDRLIANPALGLILIARDGARAVATACLVADLAPTAGGNAASVGDMVIAPDYRGEGLGAALLARLMAAARCRGWHRLSLQCHPRHRAPLWLYRSRGFHPSPLATLVLDLPS